MSSSILRSKLPISLICPVRNSIEDLPRHVKNIEALADSVSEIIVIDSQSQDGTMEYMKKALGPYNAVFLDHPPGLYQSWNHAISTAKEKYLTVATVGDRLPEESLLELYRTIECFEADVVVSAPRLIASDSSALNMKWPIHDFLEASGIKEPILIPDFIWLVYAVIYMPATLLSSSAGNLYRTQMLQQNPFLHEYGHSSDSVWALHMAMQVRWVIHPQIVSFFTVHDAEPHKGRIAREGFERIREFSQIALESVLDQVASLGLSEETRESVLTCGEISLVGEEYDRVRSQFIWKILKNKQRRLRIHRRELRRKRKLRIQCLNDSIRQMSWEMNHKTKERECT